MIQWKNKQFGEGRYNKRYVLASLGGIDLVAGLLQTLLEMAAHFCASFHPSEEELVKEMSAWQRPPRLT